MTTEEDMRIYFKYYGTHITEHCDVRAYKQHVQHSYGEMEGTNNIM